MEQELILAESLRQRGLDAQTKSRDGVFEFAACMVELKQNSKTKSGGSTFSKEASEWWGVGKSQISKWVAIGENILFRTTKQLPPSMESIYNLTTLSNEDFNAGVTDGTINSAMTQADVKAYKKLLKGEPESEEPTVRKATYGWQRVAFDEGVLPSLAGGSGTTKVRNAIAAYNDDPEIFKKESKESDLREACQLLYAVTHKGGSEDDVSESDLTEKELTKVQKYERKLKREFDYQVELRVTERLDSMLPKYRKDSDRYRKISDAYKGVMTNKEYKQLLSVLHPDRITDEALKPKFEAMFNMVKDKEDVLCKAKPIKRDDTGLPRTAAEMMAMRKTKARV